MCASRCSHSTTSIRELKPEGQGTILLDTTSSLGDLLTVFANGTRAVLDEHGLAGYRDAWVKHDFPLAGLEALDRAIGSRSG